MFSLLLDIVMVIIFKYEFVPKSIKQRIYVIQFLSEAYILQNNTTIDGQVISSVELVVKA